MKIVSDQYGIFSQHLYIKSSWMCREKWNWAMGRKFVIKEYFM